jgi:RNA polymerase-binding transcription factor DksA
MAIFHTLYENAAAELLDEQRARCESSLLEEVSAVLARITEHASENGMEAFAQLADGTYGFCLDCHLEIPADRLDSVSFAVRCAPCDRLHNAEMTARPGVEQLATQLTLQ